LPAAAEPNGASVPNGHQAPAAAGSKDCPPVRPTQPSNELASTNPVRLPQTWTVRAADSDISLTVRAHALGRLHAVEPSLRSCCVVMDSGRASSTASTGDQRPAVDGGCANIGHALRGGPENQGDQGDGREFAQRASATLGPDAPLFFKPPEGPSRNPNYRGPAVKARERLAVWVREQGVDDRGISPNHAWRHLFKTRARRAGIEASIRDAIVGHAPRSTAESYEHVTVEDMAEALEEFPRYELSRLRAPFAGRSITICRCAAEGGWLSYCGAGCCARR
jgi:hypothetical protein